jgi:hypothetical protein
MKRFALITALVIVALQGCKYSDKWEAVPVSTFSVEVPTWVEKTTEIHPSAPFQYRNKFRNFYAIAETKALGDSAVFTGMIKVHLDTLMGALTKPIVTDSLQVNNNGLTGVRIEVLGKMQDEPLYFSEVFLKGKKNNYHLSVWTRGEERKLRYKNDIDKLINSFKEL